MMMGNKVSIVIPIYNAEKYLEQCLNSIVNQSYKNLEIICVDDGSTDNSRSIIDCFAEKDDRIIKVTQNNQYAGVARNNGMKKATGDYIIFLDADDWFETNMIEIMLDKAITTFADIVICNSQAYDDVSEKITRPEWYFRREFLPLKDPFSWEDIGENFFKLTVGWVWDKLFKFSFIKKIGAYFQAYKVANDENFVDRALVEAKAISTVANFLVNHRVNNKDSLESTRFKSWDCFIKMLHQEKEDFNKWGVPEVVKKGFMTDRVAQHIVWYLEDVPSDYEDYKAYYDYIKNHGLKDLKIDYSDISNDYYVECLKSVEKYDCNSFIYHRIGRLSKEQHRVITIQNDIIKEQNNIIEEQVELISIRDTIISNKYWCIENLENYRNLRIVLYGYGDVGKDLCKTFFERFPDSLVGIIDKNQKTNTKILNTYFYDIDDINKLEFDLVLISVLNDDVSDQIKKDLMSKDVPEEKIQCYRELLS